MVVNVPALCLDFFRQRITGDDITRNDAQCDQGKLPMKEEKQDDDDAHADHIHGRINERRADKVLGRGNIGGHPAYNGTDALAVKKTDAHFLNVEVKFFAEIKDDFLSGQPADIGTEIANHSIK